MDRLQFSDDELDELHEAFELFDMDGNGGITQQEMATVMRSFGQDVHPAVLSPLFRQADHNRDGKLQFSEFLHLVRELDPGDPTHLDLHRSLVIFLEIRRRHAP